MSAETVAALLARNAAARGENAAVIDSLRWTTWEEVECLSAMLAACLVEAGVNKGHRVGLLMENCAEWAVFACAAMRIGAVLVPLSTMLRLPELEAQLRVAGVRHLIAQPSIRGRDMKTELATLDRAGLPSLRNIWSRKLTTSIRRRKASTSARSSSTLKRRFQSAPAC